MEKWYLERVEKILKEVESILLGDCTMAHGVEIVIKMDVDEPAYVSYTIKEKVVI